MDLIPLICSCRGMVVRTQFGWVCKRCHRQYGEMLTPNVNDFMSRKFFPGAGEPCLFLPFLGEFGHLIMSHIRLVHAHLASHKVVCCKPGQEALFPDADEFVTDWTDPVPDKDKGGTLSSHPSMWPDLCRRFPSHTPITAGGFRGYEEWLPILPKMRIPLRAPELDIRVDVCLGPRLREFGLERNWQHWPRVAEALNAAGISFATIGHPATAPSLPGEVIHSGGDCMLAIHLLRTCRLWCGTDSGNSHFASTVGCNMLVFREHVSGLTGPYVKRMEMVNRGSFKLLHDGWEQPEQVVENIINYVKETR